MVGHRGQVSRVGGLFGVLMVLGLASGVAWSAPTASTSDPQHSRLRHALADQLAPQVAPWSAGGTVVLGNAVMSRWCRPPVGPAACHAGDTPRTGPRGLVELASLRHEPAGADFGAVYRVVDVPDSGLGLDLSLVVGGRAVFGDHLQLAFVRAAQPSASAVLQLSDRLRYPLGEGAIEVALDGAPSPLAAAAALRASPAEFVRLATAQQLALQLAVHQALDSGTPRRCSYASYQGEGEPPACTLRPLAPTEIADERARVDAQVGQSLAALGEHGAEMFALIERWLPR